MIVMKLFFHHVKVDGLFVFALPDFILLIFGIFFMLIFLHCRLNRDDTMIKMFKGKVSDLFQEEIISC